MAHTDPAPHLNSLKLSCSSTSLLSTLLTASLTTLSYTPSTTSSVAALTHTNTHTVTLTGLQSLINHPSRTYGTAQALSHLFSTLTTSFNTNEPVLIIHSSTLSPTHLTEIAAAAANLLRYQYHVRPVRIYAGNFPGAISKPETPAGYSGAEGYSLSLLNVVNTDIGGPGMVQLLDMVDWEKAGAVRMEVWDGSGWNLMREVVFEGKGDDDEEGVEGGSGSESESGGTEKGEWESEAEAEAHDKDAKAEAEIPEEDEHVNDPPVPDIPAPLQATADTTTDTRPPLRSMKHPSWEHTQDQSSLLDMIAQQAKMSNLPVSRGGNAYATPAAGKNEKAGLEGEDEYEVL